MTRFICDMTLSNMRHVWFSCEKFLSQMCHDSIYLWHGAVKRATTRSIFDMTQSNVPCLVLFVIWLSQTCHDSICLWHDSVKYAMTWLFHDMTHSHIWMSHVTNKSSHGSSNRVTSRKRIRHDSHTWRSRVTHKTSHGIFDGVLSKKNRVMAHLAGPCHKSIESWHIWPSRVWQVNLPWLSYLTQSCHMSHIKPVTAHLTESCQKQIESWHVWLGHVTNKSSHGTFDRVTSSRKRVMSHLWMSQDTPYLAGMLMYNGDVWLHCSQANQTWLIFDTAMSQINHFLHCQQSLPAPKASWRRVFDPCTPLLFDLYHYPEQNGHFRLVPEHASGPSSHVLPSCRVWHPCYSKKLFVRLHK